MGRRRWKMEQQPWGSERVPTNLCSPGQRLTCPLAAELEYMDLEPGKSSTPAGFEGLEAARREIAGARARAG
jgi:hypothetical protein